MRRLWSFLRRDATLVAMVALAMMLLASHLRSTTFNNYVRLAYSMLHGHLWIDWPGRIIDAVAYHGKYYGVDAPLPALFMLPFVAIWGMDANETIVACVVGAACVGLAWEVCRRFGVSRSSAFWLALFMFAGTDLWWCAELGDVWFFAHLSAVFFTFLAFLELSGRRRGWLVALYAFCAAESRFTLLLAVPLYAYILWRGGFAEREAGEAPPDTIGALRSFFAVLAAGAGVWVLYNEAMWGTLNDVGHTVYYHEDSWGKATGSPFRLDYLPYQIYSFFLRAPIFNEYLQMPEWPYLKVDPNGIALTFTSPALILALFARTPRWLVVGLWTTTILVAGPSFLYYLNGWYQFGMRHALDFEPFLLILMALGVRTAFPWWGKLLCAYSALVGAWGVWYWNVFFRTGN